MKNSRITRLATYPALLAGMVAVTTSLADIPEPDTVFYGRIINRTSQQECVLTQGTLSWVINRPDGKKITLNTQLAPLNNGVYSYSLRVPQEALVFGVSVSSNSVPLTAQSANCSHVQITLEGAPVTILPPGSSTFSVSQATRSSTYRLDLELFTPLSDATGDGIADWWKAKYGVIDPDADPDHDGWSNLQEYLHGANPTKDDRTPSLLTSDIFVYASGSTGVRLQSLDADSSPTNLFYTLLVAPQSGKLSLQNAKSSDAAGSDLPLTAGASFTQDDVNRGRLRYVHQSTDSFATADRFTVSLRDETPGHVASTNQVELNVYQPNYPAGTLQQAKAVAGAPAAFTDIPGLSFYEQQMVLNYYLSRDHGYVIWDVSRATMAQAIEVPSSRVPPGEYDHYIASYGHDHPHLLVAGAGSDHLVGGLENDILIAGRGSDTLRGNGGSDLFVISGPHPGTVTIEDFNVSDRDSLDISRALIGASTSLSSYVQVSHSGTNSYLGINFIGEGNFTDLVIALPGTELVQADLATLIDKGSLITGAKVLPVGVSITSSIPAASQNGPVAGEFTLTRSGPVDSTLAVKLQITGSASNGSDYQYIDSQVTFAVGQRTLSIAVNPYITGAIFSQVVQVALSPGTGYELSGPALAQVTIEPLLPQLSIQAISPMASRMDQAAALFLVTRGGLINNNVLVRLAIGGTAPSSHYNTISPFLNFSPQQTTALIAITPKSTATLSGGVESVQITIQPDASYRVTNPASDRVLLVDQFMTFGLWQQKYFPASTDALTTFAVQDAGQTGIRNLFRYAYGLNPLAPLNSTGIPAAQIFNEHATLSFKRPPAISDLNYVVEVSNDLLHWRSGADEVEQYFPPAEGNDFETVFFRSKGSVAGSPKSFMRVRIELQP